MKKLLILAAVLVMFSSALGCRCCDWLCRGAAYNPCPPPTVSYAAPCADPCATTCGPCADTCAAPGMLTPGPAPYTSIPAR